VADAIAVLIVIAVAKKENPALAIIIIITNAVADAIAVLIAIADAKKENHVHVTKVINQIMEISGTVVTIPAMEMSLAMVLIQGIIPMNLAIAMRRTMKTTVITTIRSSNTLQRINAVDLTTVIMMQRIA